MPKPLHISEAWYELGWWVPNDDCQSTSGVHYEYKFMVWTKKVWTLISWFHQKPADLDLHCFLTIFFPIWFHGVNEKVWILTSWHVVEKLAVSLCLRGVAYLMQTDKKGPDQPCMDEKADLDLHFPHIDIEMDMKWIDILSVLPDLGSNCLPLCYQHCK